MLRNNPAREPAASGLATRLSNRFATYSAQIVAAVRDALFEERLKPGDFLGTEMDLSREFGVSRMAARDAMRTLEATGVVEIRVGAGGGARIAHGNPELFAEILSVQLKLTGISVEEIIQVQSAIEIMAARLAALNATGEHLKTIEEALTQTEQALDDIDRFPKAALAFHMGLAEASGNRVLRVQLASLQYVVWPRRDRHMTPELAGNIQAEHKLLFQHIVRGDPEAAADAMRTHLSAIKTRKMKQHGEFSQEIGCC